MLTFCLLQVDQRLQCKVYLVGHSVSLADLVLFATLYRALVRLVDFTICAYDASWWLPSKGFTHAGKHPQCADH